LIRDFGNYSLTLPQIVLSETAWDCVSDGYIRFLKTTPQSIDVPCFQYLKDLQNSAAGALFGGSAKRLIRQMFTIIIGAISKDFDAPLEHQPDYAKAGSTLKALLYVWGKDGLEDPETSTVRS